jgi:molybdate transport system permease protein
MTEHSLRTFQTVANPSFSRSRSVINHGAAPTWMENAWRLLALPLILLFLIPVATLFTRISLPVLLQNIAEPAVLQAIGVSLRTTTISLSLILLLGTPLAYLMGRYEFRHKKLLDTLIDLPTVLPPSVAGIALLITLGRRGWVGSWLGGLGIETAFTMAAVVIAQLFIAAPFYVRAATLGFASVDLEIEQAAQLDGANRWQIFRHIILPLSRASMLSGGMMSWARALGEFGATMIFAGNLAGRTQTMPTAIYLGFERNIETAVALSVILVFISFLCLLVVRIFVPREVA